MTRPSRDGNNEFETVLHPRRRVSTLLRPMPAFRIGNEHTVTVDQIEPQGLASARLPEGTLYIHGGAVPGDTLRVRVARKSRKVFEAEIVEVVGKSPLRVDPRCRYFGHCGGCKRQNLLYSAQLDLKRQAVEDAFARHQVEVPGGVPTPLAAPKLYEYRNKMEYSFGARRWLTDWEIASGAPMRKDFALGLHLPLHYDRVVDLHECHLPPPPAVAVLNGLRALALEHGWAAWNTRTHEGYLRHLGMRLPARSSDVLVNLVTSTDDPQRIAIVQEFLQREIPAVTTLVNTIHSGLAQVAIGERQIVVYGSGSVIDRIGRHEFKIGPSSFFQTNTEQAERLYELALQFADLTQDDLVYDLFSGVGTITLFVSGHAKRVLGLELDAEAVHHARQNAERNGVTNVAFESGDIAEKLTHDLVRKYGEPDVVIVDPPRAGLHPKVVQKLGALRPRRLVYVSCNPESQAKDIAALAPAYSLARVAPVDLFPHTDHVENVALLLAKTVPF